MNNKKMLSSLALLCAALLTQSAYAGGSCAPRSCNPCGEKHERRHHYCYDDKHPFFVTVGAGASWSGSDHVDVDHVTVADDASTTFWDGAVEGYHRDHGTSEVYNVALGYHWNRWFSTFVEVSRRPSYTYKKTQTLESPDNIAGLENLGDKTRYFDLKNTTITFNFDIRFSGFFDCCAWELGDHIMITPVIGAGVGVAYNRVENFHSVSTLGVRALDQRGLYVPAAQEEAGNCSGGAVNTNDTPNTAPVLLGSCSAPNGDDPTASSMLRNGGTISDSNRVHSIMLDRTKTDFVWQIRVGLAVAYKRVSFDLFYRYNDSGKFRTWDYTVDNATNALDPAKVPAWRGKMTAHELCFNCNKKF